MKSDLLLGCMHEMVSPQLLDNNNCFIAVMGAISLWMQFLVVLPLQVWATTDKSEKLTGHKNTDKRASSCICNHSSRHRVSDKGKALCKGTSHQETELCRLCNMVKVSLSAQTHRHLFTV